MKKPEISPLSARVAARWLSVQAGVGDRVGACLDLARSLPQALELGDEALGAHVRALSASVEGLRRSS